MKGSHIEDYTAWQIVHRRKIHQLREYTPFFQVFHIQVPTHAVLILLSLSFCVQHLLSKLPKSSILSVHVDPEVNIEHLFFGMCMCCGRSSSSLLISYVLLSYYLIVLLSYCLIVEWRQIVRTRAVKCVYVTLGRSPSPTAPPLFPSYLQQLLKRYRLVLLHTSLIISVQYLGR